MIYSIPYLLLTIVIGILGVLSEKAKCREYSKLYSMAGIVIFTAFVGCRGFIFHDWTTYYEEFQRMDFYQLVHIELGNIKVHEPGWMLFVLICKSIRNDFFFMVFVLTLVDCILLIWFLRRYTYNVLLSLVVLLAFNGFAIFCNTFRNLIAILIFLNAIPSLEQRKPLKYFALCLLASSFHFSSIIFFPLYFFLHKSMNKWAFLGVVLLCNVVFIAHVPILLYLAWVFDIGGDFLTEKLEVYSDLQGHRSFGLGFIERLLTSGLLFLYYDKLRMVNKSNVIFINSFICYLVLFTFFSEFDVISQRMSMLFLFSYWILWPDLIKCFHYRNNRILFSSFIGVYCLFKIALTVNQPVMEYDNWLFGDVKSYDERKYIFDRTFETPDLRND